MSHARVVSPGEHAPARPLPSGWLAASGGPDWLWPRIARAGALALRPSRWGLAFMLLVATLLAIRATELATGEPGPARAFVAAAADALLGPAPADAAGLPLLGARLWALCFEAPATVLREYWLSGPLLLLVLGVLWSLLGGAICRSAACEFAQGVVLDWPAAAGFAGSRAGALVGAVIAPPLLLLVLAALMGLGGWALLNWPVVNVLGALLFGLFLLAGAVGAAGLIVYVLGAPLLVPAIACEGSDSIDAIQRSAAYVTGRPLRLVWYALVAAGVGILLGFTAGVVAHGTVSFARHGATLLTGDGAAALFIPGAAADGSAGVAARIIAFWLGLPGLAAAALLVSYWFCACTVIYLLLRQANDAQDTSEIWMPGVLEGTMAAAMAVRASETTATAGDEDE